MEQTMKDIVEQLQSFDFCGRIMRDEAAAEILRLRAELAAARDDALEDAAKEIETCAGRYIRRGYQRHDFSVVVRALKGKP